MKKEKLYTLLTFALSLMVIMAGWFFTKSMLKQKEASVLARRGELYVNDSNLGVFDNGSDITPGESGHGNHSIEKHLSEEEMGEILAVWEMGGKEMPHEPKTGQLNMEQAIDAGKNWVASLAEQGIVPPELVGGNYDNVSAKLLSLETQTGPEEGMLSYWSVQFMEGDTVIRLTIHAVCGEIWRASITMKEDNNKLAQYKTEDLLRIAFPFMEEGREKQVQVQTDNIVYQSLREGIVYAAVTRGIIEEDSREPVLQVNLWLCTSEAVKYPGAGQNPRGIRHDNRIISKVD